MDHHQHSTTLITFTHTTLWEKTILHGCDRPRVIHRDTIPIRYETKIKYCCWSISPLRVTDCTLSSLWHIERWSLLQCVIQSHPQIRNHGSCEIRSLDCFWRSSHCQYYELHAGIMSVADSSVNLAIYISGGHYNTGIDLNAHDSRGYTESSNL